MPSPTLRITHVVESLERGGLERVVVDLCAGLKRAGHEVDIVCLFREGLLAEEARRSGVPVRALGKGPGFDIRSIRSLRSHLATASTEIVHSHNAMAAYYAALAGLAASKRVWINTRHGMGDSARLSRKERLYRASLLAYDAVAMVCDAARTSFIRAGLVPASKATVIRNGIALSRFADPLAGARTSARRALGLRDDDFVVGTVGRLNWAKDHALLIEAFVRARLKVGVRARLLIVGGGELHSTLQQQVARENLADVVRLVGDSSNVAALLPAFDIFACSSRTEGYSVALLEASAAGIPVIATRVGGNAEIVQEGETGLLVPAGDAEALSIAIETLAQDPVLRARLSNTGRDWAFSAASVEAMVERYLTLYRQF